jgi:hypothetical protein
MFVKDSFIKPLKTIPLYKRLKGGGISKKQEWGAIEGVPCLVKDVSEQCIYVESFTSSPSNEYIIDNEKLNQFEQCEVVDGKIMGLDKYHGGSIDLKEFHTSRVEVCNYIKKIKEFFDGLPDSDIIKKILNDKIGQMWATQGSSCMTIPTIEGIKIEDIANDIKRYDNMIFNRNDRWCPPITMTYEEYKGCKSFCYPIGIRPKDFCLPSELISTCTEMIKQIACFKNINSETKTKLLTLINIDEKVACECHKCKWCGEEIDANEYSSTYSSKDNFIEICHRDPNERFIPSNMYWGHGECNRQQGGYSEIERVKQISRLLKAQPHLKEYLTFHE